MGEKIKEWPREGMRIQCEDFAFGERMTSGIVQVNSAKACDFKTQTRRRATPNEKLRMEQATGLELGEVNVVVRGDNSVNVPEWGLAIWLVVDARWSGGSTGRDAFPDGWCVRAVRLDGEGRPTSDRITFFRSDTGCFCKEATIHPGRIREVRP